MRRATALAALALLVIIAAAPVARAQMPPIVRPGEYPMWATLAFGPAVNMSDSVSQFKLIQTFGYHFSGTFEGPAIAIDLQESFGDDAFFFTILPKFVWDIKIIADLGLYVTPYAGLGFSHIAPDCGPVDCSANGVSFQFGAEGRLILDGRWVVFARPLGFEVHGFHFDYDLGPFGGRSEWETGGRYEFIVGGGASF